MTASTKEDANGKSITYKVRFIDNGRFMASSLLSLADSLAKGLHKSKCRDYNFCLKYVNVEDGFLAAKCVDCTKNYRKEFDEDLAKIFASTYRFCDDDIDKLCLIIQKFVYP